MGKIIQILSSSEPRASRDDLYVSVSHVRRVEYAEPETFKSIKKIGKDVIKLDKNGKPVFSNAMFGGQRVPLIENIQFPVGIESEEEARKTWRFMKADIVVLSEDGMTVTVRRKLAQAYDEYLYTFDDMEKFLEWEEYAFDSISVKKLEENPHGTGSLWLVDESFSNY